jgi:signal transduction histidine kinase
VIASLHDEALRLSRLVADLETLASADASAFTLERQRLSLTTTVRDVAASLAGRFAERAISVTTDLAEVDIDADPVRVSQIVTNQLTNAAKFVPPGGSVALTLRGEDGWAVLDVADTGPGIPAADLPHVFERFFRSRAVRADGSGIGLAVAAELAAAHGGAISVASPPGRGTTFTTRLPAGPAMIAGDRQPSRNPSSSN